MPTANELSQLISSALTQISDGEPLDVLLLIIKAIPKSKAKHKHCPYKNTCRFGDQCWFQHHSSFNNPYSPSPPLFSERHHAAE